MHTANAHQGRRFIVKPVIVKPTAEKDKQQHIKAVIEERVTKEDK